MTADETTEPATTGSRFIHVLALGLAAEWRRQLDT